MTDSGTARMADHVAQLTRGWRERVEYSVIVNGTAEERVHSMYYDSLISQLNLMSRMPASVGSGGCNPNKSGSRPPINMAPVNLVDDIRAEAIGTFNTLWSTTTGAPLPLNTSSIERVLHNIVEVCAKIEHVQPNYVNNAVKCGESWVRRARVMLGYETREVAITGTVCHVCQGVLVVAADASSDVRCIDCGHVYPRWSWLSMLGE